MNETLKLPDDLCKAARHRAVDAEKSFSAYMVGLLEKDLEKSEEKAARPETWMDAFSGDEDDPYLAMDFPLADRKTAEIRKLEFED